MPNKPRKPIAALIGELQSWLPNYDHGPADYPTLLWRILASLPGGDRAEDMGYEAFQLGWHEADQLGRVLEAIQDKRDVEDIIAGLLADEEGEVEEARRRNPMARAREVARRSAPPVRARDQHGDVVRSAHRADAASRTDMSRAKALDLWRLGNNSGAGYAPYTDVPGEDTIEAAVAAAEQDGWELVYDRRTSDEIAVLRNADGEWMGIGGDDMGRQAWAIILTDVAIAPRSR